MPASTRLKSKERPTTPGLLPAIQRFSQNPHFQDYLGLLLLGVQNLALAFLEPFHRLFSLDDRRLQFPHAEVERVPVTLCLAYAALLPLLSITAYTLLFPSRSAKAQKLHTALLGLATSLLLATFVTDLIKNSVGRPRPDLIARCKPAPGTPTHELVSWEVCTETDHHTLHDGFRSFPSGHSSFAWSGLGYLALFLAGQLRALGRRGGLVRVVVAGMPTVAAMLITISRTEDYRHDVFDVTIGSVIGGASAWFCYRRGFRALVEGKCDVPYDRSAEDEEDEEEESKVGFERVPDREVEMRESARMV
ncbi:phosphatidic acid phosphatase type 2/haloperoxidase [Geopyxis carbonaria]|nr:phosphatidic acid phosphatase type 2/haloperoxidase [Geopyxis carbonaria]